MRNSLTRRERNMPSRWGYTDPFTALQNEIMGRMMEGFGDADVAAGIAYPSVDVEERDEDVHVTAEVPGLTKDDIQLEISPGGDALSMRGEKRQEEEKSDKGYRRVERMYGSFQRDIPLPARVDPNRVQAKLDNGVLTVDLGKANGEQGSRRIEVQSR